VQITGFTFVSIKQVHGGAASRSNAAVIDMLGKVVRSQANSAPRRLLSDLDPMYLAVFMKTLGKGQ
jgi:hypothetical protein